MFCNFGYFLYTGKVCYLFENKEQTYKEKILSLIIGLLGNLIGVFLVALVLRLINRDAIAESMTSMGVMYSDSALLFKNLVKSVDTKINYSWYTMIILSAFCGMLVYIAVEGFKVINNPLGKYVVLILAVSGFIICGFEHSIANMFYYFLAGNFTIEAFLSLLLCVIGNSIGGLIIPSLKMLMNKIEK